MRSKKIFFYFLFLIVLLSCSNKKENKIKCIQVIDKNNKGIQGVKVSFNAIRDRNMKEWGGLVTKLDSLYHIELGKTDLEGKICIENHIDSDINYVYKNKLWHFETETHEQIYLSFDNIPLKFTLKIDKNNPFK